MVVSRKMNRELKLQVIRVYLLRFASSIVNGIQDMPVEKFAEECLDVIEGKQ